MIGSLNFLIPCYSRKQQINFLNTKNCNIYHLKSTDLLAIKSNAKIALIEHVNFEFS